MPRSRTARIQIRVSEEEKERVAGLAAASGLSITDYVLWSCLYPRQTVYTIDKGELAAARTELARQGNNLNQIAYALNTLLAGGVKGQRQRDEMLEDCLGAIVRQSGEAVAAYNAVLGLQGRVCAKALKRDRGGASL